MATEPVDESNPLAGRRLLICDEDGVTVHLIRRMAGRCGLQVVGEAAGGREAVALARQHQPDIVILDLYLRDLDGLQAAEEILATVSTCLVFFSAVPVDWLEPQTIPLGAAGCTAKPASADSLVADIQRFYARWRETGRR